MTQDTALTTMKMGYNVFLTGAPGTGKTHTLNLYLEYLRSHGVPVAVTASTGIAASHIGGMTLHSFFGIGIKDSLTPYDIENLTEKKYLWDRMKDLKVLVIDEISMVSPSLLDSLNQLLKTFKLSDKVFGGIQVILVGDFFQLPPVSTSGHEKRFCFESDTWRELSLSICYLETSYRHKDDQALDRILNEIRQCIVSENSLQCFRDRWKKKPEGTFEHITKLYTHNANVDAINQQELNSLSAPLKVYSAVTKGSKKMVERIYNSSLVCETLHLKKGALVCFIKNNYEKGYINGTLGTVVNFDVMNNPIIETYEGKRIKVERMEWIFEDGDGKPKARVEQIPLRLAWALTIHKSQGMTLTAAEIDLSRTFEPGQGYVALSRIQKLSGLNLTGFQKKALEVDVRVANIDKEMREQSNVFTEAISHISKEEIENMVQKHLNTLGGSSFKNKFQKKQNLTTHEKTRELLEQKYDIETIARKRDLSEDTILKHIQALMIQYPELDISYLQPSKDIIEALEEARSSILQRKNKGDFLTNGDISLKAYYTELNELIDYSDIKKGILFLEN